MENVFDIKIEISCGKSLNYDQMYNYANERRLSLNDSDTTQHDMTFYRKRVSLSLI